MTTQNNRKIKVDTLHPSNRILVKNSFHLENSVRSMNGVYSCAIDSFIEMIYHVLKPILDELNPHLGTFGTLLLETCARYQLSSHQFRDRLSHNMYAAFSRDVRQQLWDYIIINYPSFTAKDCNAQFSEIFQERVFSFSNDLEKAVFLCSYTYTETCNHCTDIAHKCTCTVPLFNTFPVIVPHFK